MWADTAISADAYLLIKAGGYTLKIRFLMYNRRLVCKTCPGSTVTFYNLAKDSLTNRSSDLFKLCFIGDL